MSFALRIGSTPSFLPPSIPSGKYDVKRYMIRDETTRCNWSLSKWNLRSPFTHLYVVLPRDGIGVDFLVRGSRSAQIPHDVTENSSVVPVGLQQGQLSSRNEEPVRGKPCAFLLTVKFCTV